MMKQQNIKPENCLKNVEVYWISYHYAKATRLSHWSTRMNHQILGKKRCLKVT